MSDIVEFKPTSDDGRPKLQRARGASGATLAKPFCAHRSTLHINEDTQLVSCKACGLEMSAYAALMVITKQWERMHYDVTEWKKMKEEHAKNYKLSDVKRRVRELQWIECPEEGNEPARTYWLKLRDALGSEPYAMFRRGRGKHGVQYCLLNETGWSDADCVIESAEWKRAQLAVANKEQAGTA